MGELLLLFLWRLILEICFETISIDYLNVTCAECLMKIIHHDDLLHDALNDLLELPRYLTQSVVT